MIRRVFRRCGNAPGALTSEDQAAVNAFRAMLAALRSPEPWTSGHNQDVAIRVGPFRHALAYALAWRTTGPSRVEEARLDGDCVRRSEAQRTRACFQCLAPDLRR